MDTVDPLTFTPTPRNPIRRTAAAVSDMLHRIEANVLNMPLTSVVLATLLGAGVVSLAVMMGRPLRPRLDPES